MAGEASAALNVLLCATGTVGDVHPLLAIGAELRRRGHRATVFTNERFGDAVRRAGCEFVAVQSAAWLHMIERDPSYWRYDRGNREMTRAMNLEPMERTYRAVVERDEPGRTVVAAQGICFAARLAQETHGIPTATLYYNGYWFRSMRGLLRMPRPMIVGSWVPRAYMALQWRVADYFYFPAECLRELNALRRRLGLAPVGRPIHDWWDSPERIIGLFPEWWYPPQPDWPPQTRLVGFPVYDRGETETLDGPTEQFLAAGDPPVLFSPGASPMHVPAYFAAAIEACRRLGRRALLITSAVDALPAPLPPHVHHVRYAPFGRLLPRVAAVVHQAGIGTTSLCMRAGVPQVCVPSVFNQPDTAERLRRFGVSATIMPERFSASRLETALRRLLDSDDVRRRCADLAKRFGPPNEAAERAADYVTQLATSRR